MPDASAKKVVNLCMEDTFDIEDLEGRRLYINFGIDESVIESIVYQIMRFNREDKGKPVEERTPIKLFINSPGGDVCAGYGLIDAILTSKTPVYTINQAMCASMGFLIFIAGDKRYTMPHSEFLMHDGSTAGWDSTAKMKDRMDFELGELEQMTREYILSRTQITEDMYKEKYRVEWYFLPKLAKEIGVADYIIGEDCDIDEII
jgi:ATP-dependent Clp protease protease subunit